MNGKAVSVMIQTGVPTHIIGGPGIGKTSFIKQLSDLSGRHLETFIASVHEPSDIGGLPFAVDDKYFRMLMGPIVQNILRAGEKGQESILFMDEISTAPHAMQAGCLRLVNERVVGDVRLPDTTWIALASNPVDTSSGTFLLSAALANRMGHVEWNVDVERWVIGMLEGFEITNELAMLPGNWEAGIPSFRVMVASFIKHKPTMLYNPPKDAENAGKAWASPRTWTDMVCRVLAACRAANLEKELEQALVAGCIGDGTAIEFLTWERSLDLVDPAYALANAETVKLPQRGDQIFAMLTSIISHAKNKMDEKTWAACWIILGRAAEGGHADLAALPARMLAQSKTEKLPVPKDVRKFLEVLQLAGLMK